MTLILLRCMTDCTLPCALGQNQQVWQRGKLVHSTSVPLSWQQVHTAETNIQTNTLYCLQHVMCLSWFFSWLTTLLSIFRAAAGLKSNAIQTCIKHDLCMLPSDCLVSFFFFYGVHFDSWVDISVCACVCMCVCVRGFTAGSTVSINVCTKMQLSFLNYVNEVL